MIEHIEALRALHDTGTTGLAAVRLRLTQSAVSKRIAALEARVGAPLVERVGRRMRLTAEGERVLTEAEPLLARLTDVLQARAVLTEVVLRVAASESLLSSWLPAVLRTAVAGVRGLRLELHAHRGPSLVERVRSGDYALGICVEPIAEAELAIRPLGAEPMVIVPAGLGQLPGEGPVPVWTIEATSLTWQALSLRLARSKPVLSIEGRLESFTALVQIARAGFANALVPQGVAEAMGVSPGSLASTGLTRPLAVVARSTTLSRPGVADLLAVMRSPWPS
jgi:DNA-binding transcriptional LysR family regulator